MNNTTRMATLQCTIRNGQKCGNTFKTNLPNTWIRDMGLNEITRGLLLEYDETNKIIVIRSHKNVGI